MKHILLMLVLVSVLSACAGRPIKMQSEGKQTALASRFDNNEVIEADQELVTAWLAMNHVDRNSQDFDNLFWSFERVYDLCKEQPDQAWSFILAAWHADQSQTIEENLSAGPLEDLLAAHGPLVIERVEVQARNDPSFASLLGGVWKNAMSEDVWNRVQAVRDRRGWDGIPAAQPGVQADVHEKP